MSDHAPKTVISRHAHLVSFKVYAWGFCASLIATGLAFAATQYHLDSEGLSKGAVMAIIGVLALFQFVVQTRHFLHVGAETKPRIKLLAFYFMLLVVVIVVAGSIWIMQNLNYHMHVPADINQYMYEHDSL